MDNKSGRNSVVNAGRNLQVYNRQQARHMYVSDMCNDQSRVVDNASDMCSQAKSPIRLSGHGYPKSGILLSKQGVTAFYNTLPYPV